MNRVAIVTGGAIRIGRELSLHLARMGYGVCIHYNASEDAAEGVAREIADMGREVTAVQADLAQSIESARRIFDRCHNELGPASVLINCAAIFEPATLDSTNDDNWRRHLDINLASPVFLCQAFARQLPEEVQGNIINIVDWRAERPFPGHLPYTISKAGLVALTKLLAQELAPKIRVNAIAPGAILPPPGVSQAAFQAMTAGIPLKRTGTPSDIAAAAEYLLNSEFVTGEILHVTGGQEL